MEKLFILNKTNSARVLVLGGSLGVVSLKPYEAKEIKTNLISSKAQEIIRGTLNAVCLCEEVPSKYVRLHELYLNPVTDEINCDTEVEIEDSEKEEITETEEVQEEASEATTETEEVQEDLEVTTLVEDIENEVTETEEVQEKTSKSKKSGRGRHRNK